MNKAVNICLNADICCYAVWMIAALIFSITTKYLRMIFNGNKIFKLRHFHQLYL